MALKRRYRLGVLTTVAMGVAIATLTPREAVHAQSAGSVKPTAVAMFLDCTHMSATARAYASAHSLCSGSRRATPDNTVYGNCGWASLNLYGQSNHWVTIYEDAYSTLGPIVYVNWGVSLYNWSRGVSNYRSGSQGQFSASFSHTDFAWMGGSGYVTASMAGGVTLWWGGSCSFNYPTASVNA